MDKPQVNVVMLEDNVRVLNALKTMLPDFSEEIRMNIIYSSQYPQEILDYVVRSVDDVDFILVDHDLGPGQMQGTQVINTLWNSNIKIPFGILTAGICIPEDRDNLMNQIGKQARVFSRGLFTKPLNELQIQQIVRSITCRSNVIIADNEDTVREIVFDMLNRSGIRVLASANSGRSLIDTIDKYAKRVALVLTDNDMESKGNGLDVLRTISTKYPHIRKALMTGGSMGEEDKIICDLFFKKPFEMADFVKKIKEILT